MTEVLRLFEPDTRFCRGCSRDLPLSGFWKSGTPKKRGYQYRCIECMKASRAMRGSDTQKPYRVRYRTLHREERAAKARARAAAIRLEVLNHYSGDDPKCACCGEDEIKFLVIDHINGSGNKHRREQKAYNLADWLRRNGFPPGFRILCQNCNAARSLYGECPHVAKSAGGDAHPASDRRDRAPLPAAPRNTGRPGGAQAGPS